MRKKREFTFDLVGCSVSPFGETTSTCLFVKMKKLVMSLMQNKESAEDLKNSMPEFLQLNM